jgi:hypothetical protein
VLAVALGPVAPALARAAALVLGTTLLVSAALKVRSGRAALARAVAALGVPTGVAPVVAVALPVAEAATGAALLVAPAPAPAWVATALLVALSAFVVVTLPRRQPCPCFGTGASSPTGAPTLVRNAVLLAAAVLATGPTQGARPGTVATATVLVGAVVGVTLWWTERRPVRLGG